MLSERNAKLSTLLSLYMAQAIPMSFFTTVVPAIMRQQHYSLEAIGLLQLVKLPWIIKFLWAPLVDRTGSSTKGYKRWILMSEGMYAMSVAALAFFSLEEQFTVIVVMMVIAITASATQDIATDAWAILNLKKDERSLGNSMQSMGSFIGAMIGGGALLVVYNYMGWKWLLFSLAVVVLLALIPLVAFKSHAVIPKRPRSKAVSFKDIGSFFLQPGMMPHLLFLGVFHSSLIGIMTMIKPFLIDNHYAIKDVGLIAGIFGTAIGAMVAMVAGILMRRLGRSRAAMAFAIVNLLPAIYFLIFHSYAQYQVVVYTGAGLLWGAYAMGMVLVFTVAMDRVRHCREGTDFTMQIVIVHLGSLIISVMSGKIAGGISYAALFAISLIMGVLTLLVVYYRFYLHKMPGDEPGGAVTEANRKIK
jgi:MFS family permease